MGELRFGGEEQEEWPSIRAVEKEPEREVDAELPAVAAEEDWPRLQFGESDASEAEVGELLSVGEGVELEVEEEPEAKEESGGLGELRFGGEEQEEEWPTIQNIEAVVAANADSQNPKKEVAIPIEMTTYQAMTVKQLKQLCRERRLSRYSNLSKLDLIALLQA